MPDLSDILARLGRLEDATGKLRDDVSTVRERVSHMMTTAQTQLTVWGGVVVLAGLTWLVFSTLGPKYISMAVSESVSAEFGKQELAPVPSKGSAAPSKE